MAIKDAFKATSLEDINTLLNKLYYLYRKSPKRLRELCEFCEVYEKSVPKPAKASGTHWISRKFTSMNIFLKNYVIFIIHLESLANTDLQALKRHEIEVYAKKWQYAKLSLHIAMYLDVLISLKVLSVSLEQEKHDPVYMLRNVHEFNWLMSKLQQLVENAFEGSTKKLTNYAKFLSLKEQNETDFVYQDIKLKDFESSKAALEKLFVDMVRKICSRVESRFEDLRRNHIYEENLIPILGTETWPDDADILFTYGESCINEIVEALESHLISNQCNIKNIPNQWSSLKQRVIEIKTGCATKLNYLDMWQKLLVNKRVKSQCSNVLHVIKLLLITPFTNAKLE